MSYNLTTWKTKLSQNLIIPLAEIKKLPYVDIDLDEIGNVEITGTSERFKITGILKDLQIHVHTICHGGEGSGHTWDAVKKCLQFSTGELIATLVWEGGDYITRLFVIDGAVREEEVEL